jgi:transposase InsO family protein
LSKCTFATRSIAYLGHVISAEGVQTDPHKVTAVLHWPTPNNAKELRSFLGLAGYYRKFIKHFGIISKPLTNLLRKNTMFCWTQEHEVAFQCLKSALSQAPVLALPDFSKQFILETDACAMGIGAVLMQAGHPLAFVSKALGPKTRGLSTYEKEYLAILMAVEHWRSYLQHAEFIIHTDQRSLVHLNEQRLHTHWQQKVFTKLLGLHYSIVYKKGSDNRVADALSRRSHHEASCLAISVSAPSWVARVVDSYSEDAHATQLLAKLSLDNDSVPHFSLQQGLLRFKNRIWIGDCALIKQQLVEAFHQSPLGGHSGVPVTYRRLKQAFAWKGMRSFVQAWVQSCSVCQQAKTDRTRSPGLLQPLDIPPAAWNTISMDFIEGLPKSSRYNCVLVVVDLFTKYAHFVPLTHPFTAVGVAHAFFHNIYKLHGLPAAIVSDRDRIFTSNFWRELFQSAGVNLHMSSAYHPQSDGQTERVNQCLETYLRCFVHACPSKWSSWLSAAEYWYNTSYHSSIGRSPFEALYGYPPKHFGLRNLDSSSTELSDFLHEKVVISDLLRQHLSRAKNRMKSQADKKRSERVFQIGDMVFLKLQPYVQTSLAPRASQKLSFRYFGPYKVLAKIGTVAYTLDLPASAAIHPTFHVSQLKRALPPMAQVTPELPDSTLHSQFPVAVLQRRVVTRGLRAISQGLIRWSSLPLSLATWEDLEPLKQRFPSAPAWGQAGAKGGEDVSHQEHQTQPWMGAEGNQSTVEQETRPKRLIKPNSRVTGPQWSK